MLRLLRRLLFPFRQHRFDAELSEELEFHREMAQRDMEARGLDRQDARTQAQRALGSMTLAKDQARDVWVHRYLQGLVPDIRLAVRSLVATPLVTFVAILSLAAGIGGNTAIFSLINSLLLRELPVLAPDRLVVLGTPTAIAQGRTAGWTYGVWRQLREHVQGFDGVFAWSLPQRFSVGDGSAATQVDGLYASGEYFEALGARTVLGRPFTSADDVRGGGPDGPVAVVSYAFWQRQLAGATDVIGRSFVVERVPFTIVGVTPASFFGAEVGQRFDIIVPIGDEPLIRGRHASGRTRPVAASDAPTEVRGVPRCRQRHTASRAAANS